MTSQTEVGRRRTNNGTNPNLRSSDFAELVVLDGGSKYKEMAIKGDSFIGANLGGTPVTTQAGLSATTPALTLYNPVGSGVYLVLNTVCVNITTSPAAATGLMLAYNATNATAPASTTDATITPMIIGESNYSKGKCYRVATLAAAPVAFRFIGGTTGAAAIGGVQIIDHVDGEVIIPPGVAVSLQASSATVLVASFSWEETPISL